MRIGERIFLWVNAQVLKITPRRAPGRFWRWVFRQPIILYRLGLGGLIGKRILILTTRGRKTGMFRQTALSYGLDPQTGIYQVGAGWERPPDWYQNLLADPCVQLQVGSRRIDAVARVVPVEENARQMAEHLKRDPYAAGTFSRWLDIPVDGSLESLKRVGERFPSVQLIPLESSGDSDSGR